MGEHTGVHLRLCWFRSKQQLQQPLLVGYLLSPARPDSGIPRSGASRVEVVAQLGRARPLPRPLAHSSVDWVVSADRTSTEQTHK